MEFLNWLKKVFTPPPAAMGRASDASPSGISSSSRDDGSDVFGDSYFNGPDGDESDSSSGSDSSSDGGGDGGGSGGD